MATKTKTPSPPDHYDPATLRRLKISPEVGWFLLSRGIPLPTCPPRFKTPEPRRLAGAKFDPERVDKVLKVFSLLRHTQGQWAGRPLNPDPWQIAYILAPVYGWVRQNDAGDYVRIIRTEYVELPRKNGKGLHTETMILTRHGWKKFGDLQIGDEVHTIDGSLTPVTYVSPVREIDCYRVTFADGQSLVCDEDHLWTVWDRYGHDPEAWAASKTKGAWRTIATPQLAETYRVGSRRDTRYSVRMDRTIERPTAVLPIEPYLLGLWLGDGHTKAARITTVDEAIWRAFEGTYQVHRVPGTITHAINGGFRVALRELGVLGDKHVPEAYLLASSDQRMALLRGLMDTDGSVIIGPNTPRVEFSTTRRQLADAVLFLARSLGWKATVAEGRAMLDGRDCGPKWRISWTAHRDRPPFALERKASRLHLASAKTTRSTTNTIANVERIPTVPTMCIQVEHGSHQYLAGSGLIPTHNTTLGGGQACYLTTADGEAGAQVIAAAAGKDQARFCFDPIRTIAEKSPALSPYVKVMRDRITHPRSGSYFTVVSALADLIHGANIHAAVIDELHVHKDGALVEAITTGTGARAQPLIVIITTADDGKPNTVYAQTRTRVEQLARGALIDPSVYGVIWGADAKDDPHVESTWIKANPGYGISPTREFMAAASTKAASSPADLASFQRLHLGLRTKQVTKYITLASWDRNAGPGRVDEQLLEGRECFGGLDLASTSDITALSWLFPAGDGTFDVIWRLWIPEDNLEYLDKRTASAATGWVREGWLTTTPGNVTDYDWIRAKITADAEVFDIQDIAYDRWNSSQMVNDLVAEGMPMSPIGQGYASLSAPTKELQRLLLQGKASAPVLRHGANPVLRWMIDNLTVQMDAAGNVKPDKGKAADKIDGIAALVNALERTMRTEQPGDSVYDERGPLVL